MWMMPLHLHVNQKFDYDMMMMNDVFCFVFFYFRLQLRRLDFRNCAIPDGEKILKVLKLTSNAG